MSPTILRDGQRIEITEAEAKRLRSRLEYYRSSHGEPLARRVGDGEILEKDLPAQEAVVAAAEAKEERRRIRDAAAAAIQTLSGSAEGQAALDLLLILAGRTGDLPIDFAKRNGWIPPSQRGS